MNNLKRHLMSPQGARGIIGNLGALSVIYGPRDNNSDALVEAMTWAGYEEAAITSFINQSFGAKNSDIESTAADAKLMKTLAASPAGMAAMGSSPSAMEAITLSDIAMKAIAESENAIEAIIASGMAMEKTADSSVAMKALVSSRTAMSAIVLSRPAITAISLSTAGMEAITGSKIAMNALASSRTAMAVIAAAKIAMEIAAGSEEARKAIETSNIAISAINSTHGAVQMTYHVKGDERGVFRPGWCWVASITSPSGQVVYTDDIFNGDVTSQSTSDFPVNKFAANAAGHMAGKSLTGYITFRYWK